MSGDQGKMLTTGRDVSEALEYLDLALKLAHTLTSFYSNIYWFNFVELLLFFFLTILFLRFPSQMYFLLLHVHHILRAAFGFALLKRVP